MAENEAFLTASREWWVWRMKPNGELVWRKRVLGWWREPGYTFFEPLLLNETGVWPLSSLIEGDALEEFLTSVTEGKARPKVYLAWRRRHEVAPDSAVLMEKVSLFLEKQIEINGMMQFHRPLSRSLIARAVGGQGHHVLTALRALVDEGYVTFEDGPRGSTLHRSLKPFRVSEAVSV